MYWGYGHMMNGWGWAIMGFAWIVAIVVIALVVYFISAGFRGRGYENMPRETPLEILKKRYARGEITKEDYDRMKKDLQE